MRKYVVGFETKENNEIKFEILATMDNRDVAMYVRNSYRKAYEKAGVDRIIVQLLSQKEVTEKYKKIEFRQ